MALPLTGMQSDRSTVVVIRASRSCARSSPAARRRAALVSYARGLQTLASSATPSCTMARSGRDNPNTSTHSVTRRGHRSISPSRRPSRSTRGWSGTSYAFRWTYPMLALAGRSQRKTAGTTMHSAGPSALLLRRDLLQEFLARENLTICWAVAGGKRVLRSGLGGPRYPELHMSGAYVLSEKGVTGFVKRILDEVDGSVQTRRVISTYRSAT